jgi:hypothetical protein
VTPKLTRRAAAKVAAAIVAAPSLAAAQVVEPACGTCGCTKYGFPYCSNPFHLPGVWEDGRRVDEPEPEIRPVLPFSEEQARALTRPTVQSTKGD